MTARPQTGLRLTALVRTDGINPYVEVSRRLADHLGGGPNVAVLVKVAGVGSRRKDSAWAAGRRSLAAVAARLRAIGRLGQGGWFRTTIVPSRSGAARLYLDQWIRGEAGVGVGDRIRLTLRPDRAPRALAAPAALRKALAADGKARAAWEALAPSRRREVLSYLNFLKTPEALARNVRKLICRLVGGRRRGISKR